MLKTPILLLFLLAFHKAYSQDTLTLKITNMQDVYQPCMNHWFPCGTLLFGKPVSSVNPDKVYTIHVFSTDILNRLPKNSSSIYRVILRKRYGKDPFEKSDGEAYSLIEIRSVW
jgi:hypothetical protein